MAAKGIRFRNTLALKLTLVIEAILVLAIVTVTAVHLQRQLARMNLTVALTQRAFTTLEPAAFELWLKEIYRLRLN